MKKILPYLILVIVGIAVGCFTTRCFFKQDKVSQIDTLIVYKRVGYSRIDLKDRTYKINVPDIDVPELVLIPADSTSIIYKDSVRYITTQRQFFYTRTPEVEIFHSGLDSRIDSLNVSVRNTIISNNIVPKDKKHSLGIGIEANYVETFSVPVQVDYSYKLNRNFSVYGYVEYELVRRQIGAGIGTRVSFDW